MARAVVGIGSNLGDRIENMRAAVRWIRRMAAGRLTCSPVYETDPIGPPQPLFLNAAVLFEEERHPRELLKGLIAIERELGRIRTERWGPRIIDLDILWIEGLTCSEPGLDVPHASLTERAFALRPLLDLVPDARDPRTGQPFSMPPTSGTSGGKGPSVHATELSLSAAPRARGSAGLE
jgi:2-amino-4-hydroxy-6-hydroxymethyldihydropteridine diphosphokinase